MFIYWGNKPVKLLTHMIACEVHTYHSILDTVHITYYIGIYVSTCYQENIFKLSLGTIKRLLNG